MKPIALCILTSIFASSIGVTLPWSRPDPMFAELKSASDALDKLRTVESPEDNSSTTSGSSVSEHLPAEKKKKGKVKSAVKGALTGTWNLLSGTASAVAPYVPLISNQAGSATMSAESVVTAKNILGTRVTHKLEQLDAKIWREITSWSPRYRTLVGSDLVDHVERAMNCTILVSELREIIRGFIKEPAPSAEQLAGATEKVNEITEMLKKFEESVPEVFQMVQSENPLPIPTAGFALLGPKEFIARLRNISNTIRERNAVDSENAGFITLVRQFRLQQERTGNHDAAVPAEDIPRVRQNVKEEKSELLENLEKLARKTWNETNGGSYTANDARRIKSAMALLRSIGNIHKLVKEIAAEDATSKEGSKINSLLQETSKMLSHADTFFRITN